MTMNTSDVRHFDAAREGDGQEERAASGSEGVTHAVDHDRTKYGMKKLPWMDYLRHAQLKSGRKPLELFKEFLSLTFGRGRLTLEEYVQYGVFDTTRHTKEEQSRFITNTLHWPITHICCDMTWQATTEDKWLCAHILAQSGIKIPQTLAVIDKTDRIYPGTRKISTPQQFREFVTSPDVAPFFGKENRGICSFGAFLLEGADEDGVRLKGTGALGYDAFMAQFVGETPYLLQRLERNHPFFDRFTDNLATVRVCILLSTKGIQIPFAVLKLPSRANVADSFWRPGNLACNLDPASGRILGIRSKDALGVTEHAAHPETGGALINEVLPMWDHLLDLVGRCAPIFQPVRYQSMDVAITKDGPTLIEINTGGGFDLPQLASGKGFLTDEVCDFFRTCGYLKV